MDDEENTTESANPFGEMWASMWRKNWLIPVVLLLLREWSSYGYELMERMASFGFAMMNPGTFYRALRQMEKDGMVNSAWDTSGGGPARRIYSITEAGRRDSKWGAGSVRQNQKTMDAPFPLPTRPPPGGAAGAGPLGRGRRSAPPPRAG